MRPTEILKSEHRVIEQVLDCLDALARRATTEGRVDAEAAADALRFFREFADKCHHGKEEAKLFPAVEARGLPREGGPTSVMRHEHEMGRSLVRAMDAAVAKAAGGDRAAVSEFGRAARDYAQLLRDHIAKEDHCLFAMADQLLTAEDQRALEAEFERVEREEMGEDAHRELHALAGQLAARLGVPKATASGHSA